MSKPKRKMQPLRHARLRRQRYTTHAAQTCQHYISGRHVLVVSDGSIVTVIPREWLR